jgi:hypothetical protein
MSESFKIPPNRDPLPLIRLLADLLVEDYLREQQEGEATTSANQPDDKTSLQSVPAPGVKDKERLR